MARTGRKRVGQVEELAGPSEIKRLLEYIFSRPGLRVPTNRCQGCAIQRLNNQGTSDPVNPEFPVDVTRDPLGVPRGFVRSPQGEIRFRCEARL